jgi:hypothetical protein
VCTPPAEAHHRSCQTVRLTVKLEGSPRARKLIRMAASNLWDQDVAKPSYDDGK